MAKNEFLPFGIAEGANVLSNQEYERLAARFNGFISGVAKSKELNTVWRQSSVISSALAQFIVDSDNKDLLDNGDVTSVKNRLVAAIKQTISGVGYVTTAAMNLELNKKFDKANISGVLGNDNDKVPNLNLLATELGKKQPKGDYALNTDLKNKVDIVPVNLNGNDTIANQLRGGLGSCMRASAPYPSDSPTQGAFKIIQIGPDEWPTLLAFDAYGRKLWITTRKSSKGELDDWIELTNFVTPEALSTLLETKFDKDNISQQLDNDVNKVPSLDLFVKELAKKLSSVPDATTGAKGVVKLSNRITDSSADTVPTSALAAYLNVNKVGISDITNDIGTSTTKILNQKATTERLFGIGQTWKDVTSSRVQGTNYTNSSSKAIQVVITAAQSSAQVAVNLRLTITGIGSFQSSSYGSNADACVTCIIPPSASYSVSASGGSGISITKWLELS